MTKYNEKEIIYALQKLLTDIYETAMKESVSTCLLSQIERAKDILTLSTY